jgi:hypothetical protein
VNKVHTGKTQKTKGGKARDYNALEDTLTAIVQMRGLMKGVVRSVKSQVQPNRRVSGGPSSLDNPPKNRGLRTKQEAVNSVAAVVKVSPTKEQAKVASHLSQERGQLERKPRHEISVMQQKTLDVLVPPRKRGGKGKKRKTSDAIAQAGEKLELKLVCYCYSDGNCDRPAATEDTEDMVCCNSCKSWWHIVCVKRGGAIDPELNVIDIGKRNFRWVCCSCQIKERAEPSK